MSEIGHNSGGTAAGNLQSFVDRIERLEDEKATLAVDIRDVYKEAKSSGFDAKIMRKLVALRKKDHAEWVEEKALLDTYMNALGMLADLPLGQAAIAAEFGASA